MGPACPAVCLRVPGPHRAVVLSAGELPDGRLSHIRAAVPVPPVPRRPRDRTSAEHGAGETFGRHGGLLDELRSVRITERPPGWRRSAGLEPLLHRRGQRADTRPAGTEGSGTGLRSRERLRVVGPHLIVELTM